MTRAVTDRTEDTSRSSGSRPDHVIGNLATVAIIIDDMPPRVGARGPTVAELAHLAAPIPMVMVSLAGGPKHGYAVMEDIKALSRVALSSATVYAALNRLERLGLAKALPAEGGRRLRHPYCLTRLGRVALRIHLAGVGQFVEEGQRRVRARPGPATLESHENDGLSARLKQS